MALTPADIVKIARLAQLDISPEEAEKYREKLSSVLEYIDKLGELDLSKVEPTAHITGVTNVMRKDETSDCDAAVRDALLAASPQHEGDYVKVKAVFG